MAPLLAAPRAAQHLDIPRALFSSSSLLHSTRRAVVAAGPNIVKLSAQNLVLRRSLTVDSTQKVTLGVIAAYVVIIALLWNIPYVRWVLWPFKVSDAEKAG